MHTDTPLKCLIRISEYVAAGDSNSYNAEVRNFWNQKEWKISEISDPKEKDPARLAVLAAVTDLLVQAFNQRVQHGLVRGSNGVIPDIPRMEKQEKVLEKKPKWAEEAKPLSQMLVLPAGDGGMVGGGGASQAFLRMNIMREDPGFNFA